jgi:hypothetical protein
MLEAHPTWLPIFTHARMRFPLNQVFLVFPNLTLTDDTFDRPETGFLILAVEERKLLLYWNNTS